MRPSSAIVLALLISSVATAPISFVDTSKKEEGLFVRQADTTTKAIAPTTEESGALVRRDPSLGFRVLAASGGLLGLFALVATPKRRLCKRSSEEDDDIVSLERRRGNSARGGRSTDYSVIPVVGLDNILRYYDRYTGRQVPPPKRAYYC